jgi:hypothetical protein
MALLGKYATVSCAIRGAGWDACLGGLLVVGWVSCRGGAVWEVRCDRAWGTATTGTGWVWRSHGSLPVYGHDHRGCGCVTNCVTITTYHDGLRWILEDV